jgi:hypothetical protein
MIIIISGIIANKKYLSSMPVLKRK